MTKQIHIKDITLIEKAYDSNELDGLARLAQQLDYEDIGKSHPIISKIDGKTVQLGNIIEYLANYSCHSYHSCHSDLCHNIFDEMMKEVSVEYYSTEDLPKEVEKQAKKWMMDNKEEYDNSTELAEECGNIFGIYVDDECTIHERIYELSVEVMNEQVEDEEENE